MIYLLFIYFLIFSIHWLIFSYQPLNLLWMMIFYMMSLSMLFFKFLNLWFFCILLMLFLSGVGIMVLYFISISYQYSPQTYNVFLSFVPGPFLVLNFNSSFSCVSPHQYFSYFEMNWMSVLILAMIFLLLAMLGMMKLLEIYKGAMKMNLFSYNKKASAFHW